MLHRAYHLHAYQEDIALYHQIYELFFIQNMFSSINYAFSINLMFKAAKLNISVDQLEGAQIKRQNWMLKRESRVIRSRNNGKYYN